MYGTVSDFDEPNLGFWVMGKQFIRCVKTVIGNLEGTGNRID